MYAYFRYRPRAARSEQRVRAHLLHAWTLGERVTRTKTSIWFTMPARSEDYNHKNMLTLIIILIMIITLYI